MTAQTEVASKQVIRETLLPDAQPHLLESAVDQAFHWATVTGGLIDVIRMDPLPTDWPGERIFEVEDSTGYIIHLHMTRMHVTEGIYDPQTGSRFFPDWDDH